MSNYTRGSSINSLDTLYQQEFIFFDDKVYHKGWFSMLASEAGKTVD